MSKAKKNLDDLKDQKIMLIDVAENQMIIGSEQGDIVLSKLRSLIWVKSSTLEISFKGMTGVDACFIRNSLASLTKIFLGFKGIMVSDVENEDVLDNLVYGFHALKVPLILKNNDGTAAIYADLSSGSKELLSYVYSQSETTTQKVVKQFDISAPNASAKLKKLHREGYLTAEQHDAPTGGIEYVYSPFFTCDTLTYLTTP